MSKFLSIVVPIVVAVSIMLLVADYFSWHRAIGIGMLAYMIADTWCKQRFE